MYGIYRAIKTPIDTISTYIFAFDKAVPNISLVS